MTSDTLTNFPNETQKFFSETTFYQSGAYIGSISKEGEFGKGEEFALEKLKPETAGDYQPNAEEAAILFRAANRMARQIKSLVKALANYQGALPGNLLLESISPNSRFLVTWDEVNPDEGISRFQLYDLENQKHQADLPQGRTPGGNHAYRSSEWSSGGEFLIFINDGKWSTESAAIVKVDPGKGSARVMGDLYGVAGNYAWSKLETAGHPFTRERDSIFGLVQVESLRGDGSVDLVLDSQSKYEGPENNVRTAMTILLGEGEAEVNGFQILEEYERPMFSKPVDFLVSSNKFGPITRDTPFNVKVVRTLFPRHEVVAGSETFEEGGEQPVIHVKAGNTILLTIVPFTDEARIGRVYTNSPGIPLQFGTVVGDSFGGIFNKIGSDVVLEGISGDVIAGAPGIPNVALRFLPGDPNSGNGDLPPFAELKDWKLHTIEWFPHQ